MDYKIGICSHCKQEGLIVNNFFKLCSKCNKNRLINKKEISPNKGHPKKINPISKKNTIFEKNLKQVYEEINKWEQKCSGCGSTNHLSRSHTIPRSRRKDLECEIKNIKIYCMQRPDGSKGCHQRWEGTLEEKKTLLDFNENMEYIKEVDNQLYNFILLKNDKNNK